MEKFRWMINIGDYLKRIYDKIMDTITIKELQDAKRQLEKEFTDKIAQFQEIFNIEVDRVDWKQCKLRKIDIPETLFVDQQFTLEIKL